MWLCVIYVFKIESRMSMNPRDLRQKARDQRKYRLEREGFFRRIFLEDLRQQQARQQTPRRSGTPVRVLESEEPDWCCTKLFAFISSLIALSLLNDHWKDSQLDCKEDPHGRKLMGPRGH